MSLVAAQMRSCCCWGKFFMAFTIVEELPTPEKGNFGSDVGLAYKKVAA